MSSYNKVIIMGNVGQDPQTRAAGTSSVCSFSVATSKTWKDAAGQKQERTTWHRIQAWGKLGELCQQYIVKGRPVLVEGEIESREYEKDGQKHTAYEIRAAEVQFLGGRDSGERNRGGDTGERRSEPPRGPQGAPSRSQWAGPAQPGGFVDDGNDIPF